MVELQPMKSERVIEGGVSEEECKFPISSSEFGDSCSDFGKESNENLLLHTANDGFFVNESAYNTSSILDKTV